MYRLVVSGANWSTASNFAASGGFGPNQVSSMLGLGALLMWLVLIYFPMARRWQVAVFSVCIWLLVQSILTFSRGGVFNAILPGLLMTSQTVLRRGQRGFSVFLLVVGILLYQFVMGPFLDQITQNSFSARFTSTDLTRRDVLVSDELTVFFENPLIGIGPGMARAYREGIATHTEYTRLLAEHGLLGLLYLGLYGAVLWHNFRKNRSYLVGRDFTMVAIAWSAAYFVHAAMRLAVPSFMLGITFAIFERDNERLP